MNQIANLCPSVNFDEIESIGTVIGNTIGQFKADMVDAIREECVSGVRDRLETVLSNMRSA